MERRVFWKFVLAAVIYLGGAIGFELLGSKEVSLHGADTILYAIYSTIEESMEIFGVILLIHILLNLLEGSRFELDFQA